MRGKGCIPITEIAERTSISRPTVYKYIVSGRIIGGVKVLGQWRVNREKFEEWFAEHPPRPVKPRFPSIDLVYFVEQVHGTYPIKIGFSSSGNLGGRLIYLRCASPYPLKLLGYMPGSMKDEKKLHRRFKAERLRGEWFEPSARLRKFLVSSAIIKDLEKM